MDFSPLYAFLSAAGGAPILRIQTILQTQDVIMPLKHGKQMKGAIDCFNRIRKEEGFRYLWRGTVPLIAINLLRQVSTIFRYFSSEKTVTTTITTTEPEQNNQTGENNPNEESSKGFNFSYEVKQEGSIFSETDPNKNILAGPGLPLAAFILACGLVIHPFEVIRTRLSADFGPRVTKSYTGVFNAGKSLVKAGGIASLYRGYLPLITVSLLQENVFKYYINPHDKKNPVNIAMRFAAEMVAYPLVVIANRTMMVTGNPLCRYKGLTDCVQRTYKDLGMKGFYQGFQITMFLYGLEAVALGLEELAKQMDKKDK